MKSLSQEYQDTPAEYGVQFAKHLDKILASSTVKVASIIWEVCISPLLLTLSNLTDWTLQEPTAATATGIMRSFGYEGQVTRNGRGNRRLEVFV